MMNIIINLKIEAFHNWPQAKEILPEVAFLSDRHRHIFWIRAEREVFHDDRDEEIILFKRKIEGYLASKYGTPCELGATSCEMLAREIAEAFGCNRVEVMEDGENGAVYSDY